MKPTSGQLALLMASVALFAIGGLISLARIWWDRNAVRVAAKASVYWGILAAIAVIVWHSAARGQWQPMKDNFESLIWLAVLLALFVLYIQRVKPIRGLDWFVMPVVILLLISAAFFGRWDFREYAPIVTNTWLWVHHASAYGGTAAFAIAATVGAMYVITSRRLREKTPGMGFGSLERLEHLMMTSVTLGFALLTIALITGAVRTLCTKRASSACSLGHERAQ